MSRYEWERARYAQPAQNEFQTGRVWGAGGWLASDPITEAWGAGDTEADAAEDYRASLLRRWMQLVRIEQQDNLDDKQAAELDRLRTFTPEFAP